MSLRYYDKEQEAFSDLYKRNLSPEQKTLIFNKLRRHFKLRVNLYTKHRKPTQSGRFYVNHWRQPFIILGRKSNLGVLVHEIAHAWEHQKHGATKHHRRLWKLQARVVRYVRAKLYWSLPANHVNPSLAVNLNDDKAVMAAVLRTEAPVTIAGAGFKLERLKEEVKKDGIV